MADRSAYDFSGWATRNNIRCSDGRTIKQNAFQDCDGKTVPLVWNHQHNRNGAVLGHALLENRPEGVYTYCSFNETDNGKDAKIQVEHGDVTSLSIYANHLKQNGGDVIHGQIREVSLVLAGANPGAYIDTIIQHCDDDEEDAEIYPPFDCLIELSHADDEPKKAEEPKKEEEPKMADEKKEKTVGDVLDTLNDEQKQVVMALIAAAAAGEGNEEKSNEGENNMKHNAFSDYDNTNGAEENVLTHAECAEIFEDAKRFGSLKESVLAHGITDIEYLFPDAKNVNNVPDFIKRPDEWVSVVMGGVSKSPFSRIRTIHADITADAARAKGYTKGHEKTSEVFTLLKRKTEPTTVYKKQQLERDDVIDITDFDVVSWMKTEMRGMLDEELARAILVGDGRDSASDDKIDETHIRPIWTDDVLYSIKADYDVDNTATAGAKALASIEALIRARKDYRGSGNPIFFTTEGWLTEALLMKDLNGRYIYESAEKLAQVLRVSKIVTVPVLENLTRVDSVSHDTLYLQGILVNLSDYRCGADKGGAVNMFDDFDIDYNAQKYLIETRMSGALIKPKSAIVLEANFQ